MSEAERIAAGLSDAQRRAVVNLMLPDGGGKWPARHALTEKGLLGNWPHYGFTPLAHEVRAILKKEPTQ